MKCIHCNKSVNHTKERKTKNKTHALLTKQMKYHAITLLWCNMQTTSNGKVCTFYKILSLVIHSSLKSEVWVTLEREGGGRSFRVMSYLCDWTTQASCPEKGAGDNPGLIYVKRQRAISHFFLWLRPEASPVDLLTSYFYLLVYTLLPYVMNNKSGYLYIEIKLHSWLQPKMINHNFLLCMQFHNCSPINSHSSFTQVFVCMGGLLLSLLLLYIMKELCMYMRATAAHEVGVHIYWEWGMPNWLWY